MEYIDRLKDYINHEDDFIAEKANYLLMLTTDFEKGDLSKDEYKELCDDAVDLSKLDDSITNYKDNTLIIDACNDFSSIIQGILSVA